MGPLRIGVVGGSIAGCSAAALLTRAGHRVTVFERSAGRLVGRGGGIGTPEPMLRTLIDEGLVDLHFPCLVPTSMPFVVRTPDEPYAGRQPWQLPLSLAAFHWGTLWDNLRSRIEDAVYHGGTEVTHVDETPAGHVIDTTEGRHDGFDLVLFADGYRSAGRARLFPEVELTYRGYMLWRGLLHERHISDHATLGSRLPRLSYTHARGNAVMYFVPDEQGRVEPGHRMVNWAAYIELPAAEVPEFMIDAEGRPRVGSLPPGAMRPNEENRLKALMAENLPSYYGDIIGRTQNTYVQLIYTTALPAYARGRMALIGDAGMVAQPFTGSGIFKGYQNAKALLDALASSTDLDAALDSWSRAQTRLGHRLLTLGEQMERAFIWDPLDLAHADAAATEAWWRRSVAFPDDFSYEDG